MTHFDFENEVKVFILLDKKKNQNCNVISDITVTHLLFLNMEEISLFYMFEKGKMFNLIYIKKSDHLVSRDFMVRDKLC